MVFSVVMYRYENRIIKNGECRIDVFELWCWRRLLGVPWTLWRSISSILKEINPKYSLGGLIQKLQHFGHLMRRTDSLEKILMLRQKEGGEGDSRGQDGWMMWPTQWTWVWASSSSWWWARKFGLLKYIGSQSQIQLSKWMDKYKVYGKFWGLPWGSQGVLGTF